ncbi:MAG: hypothetical protein K0Q73_133 [Paenibacillus sp.]|nr:hypothetical protein [Paenibacillus sp.]
MSIPLDDHELFHFYTNHLKNTLLPFWLRSVDWEDGGYFNAYDNSGTRLVSTDKFTWSQGRFVWIYAKLASMGTDIFDQEERQHFLKLAEHGAEFLMKHCLLENGSCTFLMDKRGNPKLAAAIDRYDSSIFADCFVIAGLAKYAAVSGDRNSLHFAQRLYRSVIGRIKGGSYFTEPYPIPHGYKSHSIPMILLNVTQELYEAEEEVLGVQTEKLKNNMLLYMDEICNHFMDEDFVLNEMIGTDNKRVDSLLGRYCNPGHTVEDMWFVIHAALKLNRNSYISKAVRTTTKMLELGWDQELGGIFLFVDREGGPPRGNKEGIEHTSMVKQIGQNWDSKLWWPHSEALYTTRLIYKLTGDPELLAHYNRLHDYTFKTFPNPNRSVGEWIQIRSRSGEPINQVVALPVKDPYHIIRNVILIIELLATNKVKTE